MPAFPCSRTIVSGIFVREKSFRWDFLIQQILDRMREVSSGIVIAELGEGMMSVITVPAGGAFRLCHFLLISLNLRFIAAILIVVLFLFGCSSSFRCL